MYVVITLLIYKGWKEANYDYCTITILHFYDNLSAILCKLLFSLKSIELP